MPELSIGFERFPALRDIGIKRWVNGPFTFTPDGNPLVGPVAGIPNYWAACGCMAGYSQCAGIGLVLANWIVDGDPGLNAFGMDVARFGPYASDDRYLLATTAPVLRAPVRDGVSERGAARGASAQDHAVPRGSPVGRGAVHGELGSGSAAVLRRPAGLRRERHVESVERGALRGPGGRGRSHGGGCLRDRAVRPLRGHGTRCRGVAGPPARRAHPRGGPHPTRPDAGRGRPTDGRSHGRADRRRPFLADRVVLPAVLARAVVPGARCRSATSRWRTSRMRGWASPSRARCHEASSRG